MHMIQNHIIFWNDAQHDHHKFTQIKRILRNKSPNKIYLTNLLNKFECPVIWLNGAVSIGQWATGHFEFSDDTANTVVQTLV